jgi:hypothetical protein
MPMRTDCRHYESRTYPSGETVRKCRLDLAPDAPWRCPDDCPKFEKRRWDAGWQYGSFGQSAPDVLSDFEKKNRKRRIFRRKKKKK